MATIMQPEELKTFKALFTKFQNACSTGMDVTRQWIISKDESEALDVVESVLEDLGN